jgi:hypothetical protein
MTIRQFIARIFGRDGRAEADVNPDPARVDHRTEEVGRVGADDSFAGETGAERRTR